MWDDAAHLLNSGVVEALGRPVRWVRAGGARTELRMNWSLYSDEPASDKWLEGFVKAADAPGFAAGDVIEVKLGGWRPFVVQGDIVERDGYLEFRAERLARGGRG